MLRRAWRDSDARPARLDLQRGDGRLGYTWARNFEMIISRQAQPGKSARPSQNRFFASAKDFNIPCHAILIRQPDRILNAQRSLKVSPDSIVACLSKHRDNAPSPRFDAPH